MALLDELFSRSVDAGGLHVDCLASGGLAGELGRLAEMFSAAMRGTAGNARGMEAYARGFQKSFIWRESDHPRVPAGTPEGGQFTEAKPTAKSPVVESPPKISGPLQTPELRARAPRGGARSQLTGEFYKGGHLMPTTGRDSKRSVDQRQMTLTEMFDRAMGQAGSQVPQADDDESFEYGPLDGWEIIAAFDKYGPRDGNAEKYIAVWGSVNAGRNISQAVLDRFPRITPEEAERLKAAKLAVDRYAYADNPLSSAWRGLRLAAEQQFEESKHPRGQPENAGEFRPKDSGAAAVGQQSADVTAQSPAVQSAPPVPQVPAPPSVPVAPPGRIPERDNPLMQQPHLEKFRIVEKPSTRERWAIGEESGFIVPLGYWRRRDPSEQEWSDSLRFHGAKPFMKPQDPVAEMEKLTKILNEAMASPSVSPSDAATSLATTGATPSGNPQKQFSISGELKPGEMSEFANSAKLKHKIGVYRVSKEIDNDRVRREAQPIADRWGLSVDELLPFIEEQHQAFQQIARQREEGKRWLRKMAGVDAADAAAIENAGYDHSSAWKILTKDGRQRFPAMRNFDQVVDEFTKSEFGQHIGARDESDVWALIREGSGRTPQPWDADVIEAAAEQANHYRETRGNEREPGDESGGELGDESFDWNGHGQDAMEHQGLESVPFSMEGFLAAGNVPKNRIAVMLDLAMFGGVEKYARWKPGRGQKTLPGMGDNEHWVTIHGNHVLISDKGEVLAGPKEMVGQRIGGHGSRPTSGKWGAPLLGVHQDPGFQQRMENVAKESARRRERLLAERDLRFGIEVSEDRLKLIGDDDPLVQKIRKWQGIRPETLTERLNREHQELVEKMRGEWAGPASEVPSREGPTTSTIPPAPIGQSKADKAKDAKTVAEYGDKPGVQLLRAPAGGKTSDVNGQFYKGGQIMPIHGLSPKVEPGDGKLGAPEPTMEKIEQPATANVTTTDDDTEPESSGGIRHGRAKGVHGEAAKKFRIAEQRYATAGPLQQAALDQLSDDNFGTHHVTPESLERNGPSQEEVDTERDRIAQESGLWWGAARTMSPVRLGGGRDAVDGAKGAATPATSATPESPTTSEHPVTSAINRAMVADFGEEIPGARKHLATKTGPKPKKEAIDSRPVWARKYKIVKIDRSTKPGESGKFAIYDQKNVSPYTKQPRQVGELFNSAEEAEAAIPLLEVAQKHRVYKTSKSGEPDQFAIVRKVSDRKFPVVRGGFATEREAMEHMVKNATGIIEHKFPSYEDYKYLDEVRRIGGQQRGKDIKPRDFQERFHFRGGQFGNWQQGKDGQTAINHAYDALGDLSDALGIPPEAVSLNGDLAIGFGARGTGGKNAALAHYEPDLRVMNLTKMSGAGSLAHEYGHALDHYFGKLSGLPGIGKAEHMFASEALPHKNQLRPEVVDAWKGVLDAMNRKSSTKTIDSSAGQKKLDSYQKNVEYTLSQIQDRLKPSDYRKVKPLSAEDQKKWDDAVERIRSGNVGDSMTVRPSNVRGYNPGRDTYQPIETLNDLVKKATGRQFHSAAADNRGNLGHQLYWAVKMGNIAREEISRGQSGEVATSKIPTDFLREARELDKTRTSDYYQLPHEMFARAFESYVHDKLKSQGRRSDYLAAHVENRHYPSDIKPYPEGAEREVINEAFDKLFEAIKHEESGGGRRRLYSRYPQRNAERPSQFATLTPLATLTAAINQAAFSQGG